MPYQHIFHYTVTADCDGRTVAAFLRTKGYSKKMQSFLKRIPHSIQRDHEDLKTSDMVHNGEEIQITFYEEDDSDNIVATDLPLNIVLEDDHILVVNKPAGMPCHPSQGHYEDTLVNALKYHGNACGKPFQSHIITRLDRDTSGLVLVAKHRLSAGILGQQMMDGDVQRIYVALVEGKTEDRGIVEAPIGRVPGSTIERCVTSDGDYAKTFYTCLAQSEIASLIQLCLETGRTHQIRVHMKHIGHPLPGDFLYYPNYELISRQPLHSAKLSFYHPITGEKQVLALHDLPQDMKNACQKAGIILTLQ